MYLCRMFERMGKQFGNSRLDFLQTHPSSDTRVKVGASLYLWDDGH